MKPVKTVRPRGMRDIATIQGLSGRNVAGSREQMVTELARMEHEKARLEREMRIWIGNQKRTEERLRLVQERLDLLQKTLNPELIERVAQQSAAAGTDAQANTGETPGWNEVVLEF